MSTQTHWYLNSIELPNTDMQQQALDRQLSLTKPPGSLGQLENLAVTMAAMQNRINPTADKIEITVFAGDHGVMEEGVSAFPQAVTVEMVKNFVRGGAAISVLARQLDANLTVVNAGTIATEPFDAPVVDQPIAQGTANFSKQDAMTTEQTQAALSLGKRIVDGFPADTQIVIGGEMGIGNTSSATALSAATTGLSVPLLVGPGTGLDDVGIQHKQRIIEAGIKRANVGVVDSAESALKLLGAVGGFEIAALCGYYIAAAQRGFGIVVDGFIASSAALIACQLNPDCRQWMIFAHASAEPGHSRLMHHLDAQPLIDMQMRLGEGSGAAVATSLIKHACALHNEMATFEQASVSNKG